MVNQIAALERAIDRAKPAESTPSNNDNRDNVDTSDQMLSVTQSTSMLTPQTQRILRDFKKYVRCHAGQLPRLPSISDGESLGTAIGAQKWMFQLADFRERLLKSTDKCLPTFKRSTSGRVMEITFENWREHREKIRELAGDAFFDETCMTVTKDWGAGCMGCLRGCHICQKLWNSSKLTSSNSRLKEVEEENLALCKLSNDARSSYSKSQSARDLCESDFSVPVSPKHESHRIKSKKKLSRKAKRKLAVSREARSKNTHSRKLQSRKSKPKRRKTRSTKAKIKAQKNAKTNSKWKGEKTIYTYVDWGTVKNEFEIETRHTADFIRYIMPDGKKMSTFLGKRIIPGVLKKVIDHFGGIQMVRSQRKWKKVCRMLDLEASTSQGYRVNAAYIRYEECGLYPKETGKQNKKVTANQLLKGSEVK